jgi:hypothetical protein
MEETLQDIGIGNDFVNKTPVAQEIRTAIDKWDYNKFESFCTAKEIINLLKRKPTKWKKFWGINT